MTGTSNEETISQPNIHIVKVISMFHDVLRRGFNLPIPTNALKKLPRCSLAQLGMINQGSIDDMGRLVESSRLSHDLSLKRPTELLVSSRVIEIFLSACLFEFAL
jgi:hypothetical protein